VKAAGITELGGKVHALELPGPPRPEGHQVLVEVRAAGVGNWDNLARLGRWNLGLQPPMALGVEAAGIVTALGPMVSQLAVGDEVLVHSAPLLFQGAWAERFLVLDHEVARKPPTMDWAAAGALPVPALTAWEVVRAAGVRPGDRVMVNGAAGVTGALIAAVATSAGAAVLATSSHRDPNWREAAHGFAPKGFAAVINAASGQSMSVIDVVADGGSLATITGDPPTARRSIKVIDFYLTPDGPLLESAVTEVVARGLGVPIQRTGGLAAAEEFLGAAVSGMARGAQVLLP
jgi:NADPH:quinone reductase-like Zn-dependent oxidoreductase